MSHWLLDSIEERRSAAIKASYKIQIYQELLKADADVDINLIQSVASALELATLDLILKRFEEDEKKEEMLRVAARDAFRLFKSLPLPSDPLERCILVLRASALAVLGDRGADAARWLTVLEERGQWPGLLMNSTDWRLRTWATIIDVWLRLIRKKGWADRDAVLKRISTLRESQKEYEDKYLDQLNSHTAKGAALELIALYHLAKAAENLAYFITEGAVEGNHQVRQLLDAHFDRALAACETGGLVVLHPTVRLLAATAAQLVSNSLWTVTRAVNSRVSDFVRSLVSHGRGDSAIFDVLPPQRRALAERGLLGSSRRAVVVSLPTSSGKTLIAQFRILQALNQFDNPGNEGWVAYLAPTRALVNQITRRLRRDFAPLGIAVERVSPALDIDGIEMGLLSETKLEAKFRVLVTTPEKLDLMLRQGWEDKIGRPLTLVVVDEAHNLQDHERGLRLELLLATINKECEYAQFLLLTPFISNAREIARWLGEQSSQDISLALEWQPNDRAVGIVQTVKGNKMSSKRYDYELQFEAIHTTRDSLTLDEPLAFPKNNDIAETLSQAKGRGVVAAIAAQYLKHRGPVIVMHSSPRNVWSLAKRFRIPGNKREEIHRDIQLVQKYLALELGEEFPLIELLDYGIGVHHAGLPEEVRVLIEWLFERERLDFLVATTTIAQGVNFPVSGIVMASHQYSGVGRTVVMPPEDFWNIAGRAGRVTHDQFGMVVIAADNAEKAESIKSFINQNVGDLNSALIQMALEAQNELENLGYIVERRPAWSGFLQYLVHTYRQMGQPEYFAQQVEQVLRGTLGFEKLRFQHSEIAKRLLHGVAIYAEYLQEPGRPLSFVDSTGFSLHSVMRILANKGSINKNSWNPETLFDKGNHTLRDMMGVLLQVPELRGSLRTEAGEAGRDGRKLADIVMDWVGGKSLSDIAATYFQGATDDKVAALTKCGQNLFGGLTLSASWGLGALLSMTVSDLPEEEFRQLRNLPSRVFYGVNSDDAIIMRFLGVPRAAAAPLALYCHEEMGKPLPVIRDRLTALKDAGWNEAIGENGVTYRRVWRILEGIDDG